MVIFMAESRKSTKKESENQKRGKNSVENRKREMCRKPENLKVLVSVETGKPICGNRKTDFLNCRKRKAVLKSCGKPENIQKTMKSGGMPENREKNYEKPEKHENFHGKLETDHLKPPP